MAELTDTAIRQALKRTATSGKATNLSDGEGRGTGRLVLKVRRSKHRVLAEWMAQQWRNGKRLSVKIGEYPSLSLKEARETFQCDYSNVIQRGQSIKIARNRRLGSVRDLFDGYAQSLKDAGKPSWIDTKKGLDKIADTLGSARLAREIEPDELLEVLRPIYRRGAKSMADHVRGYLHAAFAWGIKSERDYRATSGRRFGIVANPAAGIPSEPKVVGTRWLTPEEFVRLYRWLEHPDVKVHPPYALALRLLMLTGQRVDEIARLHKDQWDPAERIIDWSLTKNGLQHAIPLTGIAADLLESIEPNRFGWFFPSAHDPKRSVGHQTLYAFIWRQRGRGVIPHVTNRDLRRTWKTLAGQAGIAKDIRDRLQNHRLQDVSSKSYDRWDYMPEKREAMECWDRFVTNMLLGMPLLRQVA